MKLDEIDINVLQENFDNEIIKQLDLDNVAKIYNYLLKNGIYFAKDIFLGQVDLFLIDFINFEKQFEKLKNELGSNYIELLEENCYLMNYIYH